MYGDEIEYVDVASDPNTEGSVVRFNRRSSEPVAIRNSHHNVQRHATRERKLSKASQIISPPGAVDYTSRSSPVPVDKKDESLIVPNMFATTDTPRVDIVQQIVPRTCWQKYANFAESLTDPRLLVPVLFVLLSGSVCMLYVGTIHRSKCRFFPIINQFQGGLGITAVISQLICMLNKWRSNKGCIKIWKVVEWSCVFSFLVIYVIEASMFAVTKVSGSPGPGKRYYCEIYFYNFTRTFIWLQFLVLVSTAVINFPLCYESLKSSFDQVSKIVIK